MVDQTGVYNFSIKGKRKKKRKKIPACQTKFKTLHLSLNVGGNFHSLHRVSISEANSRCLWTHSLRKRWRCPVCKHGIHWPTSQVCLVFVWTINKVGYAIFIVIRYRCMMSTQELVGIHPDRGSQCAFHGLLRHLHHAVVGLRVSFSLIIECWRRL